MTTGAQPSIRPQLDTADLREDLRDLNAWMKGSMTELASTFAVFGTFKNVAQDIVRIMGDLAAEAGQVETIERRAAAAIGGSLDALKSLNAERQRTLGIDADEQLALQTKLAQLGVQKGLLEEATKATIGLANVTGGDLASAGTTVAKVFEGNINALKRMGIAVKDEGDAHAWFAEQYRVTAAEAGTYTRNLSALGAAVGDVREELGKLIIDNPEVNKALKETGSLIVWIAEHVNMMRGPIEMWTKGMSLWAETMKQGPLPVLREIAGLYGQLFDKLGGFGADAANKRFAYLTSGGEASETERRTVNQLEDWDGRDGVFVGPGGPRAQREGMDLSSKWNKSGWVSSMRASGRFKKSTGAREEGDDVPEGGYGPQRPPFDLNFTIRKMLAEANLLPDEWDDESTQRKARWEKGAIATIRNGFSNINLAIEAEAKSLRESVARDMAIDSLIEGGVMNLTQGFGSMFAAITSGSSSAGEAIGSFVGSTISMLGQLCIQLGTAAILAGALGSAVPLFAGIAPPQAIGLGAALVAGGAAMMAVGGAIGGATKGGSSKGSIAPSAGGGSSGSSGAPSNMAPTLFQQKAEPRQVVINFNAPMDRRAAAREIRDLARSDGFDFPPAGGF